MKAFAIALALLFTHFTFGADYRCTKTVSDGHIEFADISTRPLEVTTSYQRCSVSDGTKACETGVLDQIASSTEICGQFIGGKGECVLRESTIEQNDVYRVEVNCIGQTQLLVEIYGKERNGEISCFKNGETIGFWNVGTCQLAN